MLNLITNIYLDNFGEAEHFYNSQLPLPSPFVLAMTCRGHEEEILTSSIEDVVLGVIDRLGYRQIKRGVSHTLQCEYGQG